MNIVSVVVTSSYNLNVGFSNSWFLLEFLCQEVVNQLKVAVEQPANQAECKHITTLQHRLVVHSSVSKAVLYHLCNRTSNHTVWVDAHFFQVVIGCKIRFLQVAWAKRIGVDNDSSLWFAVFVLSFKGSCIHSYQHIALITWCVNLTSTDVHSKSTNSREWALRGTNVGRIIWECRDAITHSSRNIWENVTSQLHTITRVSRE